MSSLSTIATTSTTSTTITTSKSSVSGMLDQWQKFDLEQVKKELDDRVIEIAQQLDEGDQSRKRLIEQTKEFRKQIGEEQRKILAPILKSFQVEVDAASKRSKLMEQVLLKLYKQLIDLNDPCQWLDKAAQWQKRSERVQDLEIENKQLRDTLEEYNVEFAHVKNQEVTIKSLNVKIREIEERMEKEVGARVRDKENSLVRLYQEKEEQMQQQQFELVKKLGDAEARALGLHGQMTKLSADMYESKSKQEEQLNAKSCEVDLLLLDLDKMTERVMNAERLNEQYAKQIAADSTTQQQLQQRQQQPAQLEQVNYSAKAIELELLQKEKEISQLVEDIKKLQIKSNKTREFYEHQRNQLEERLALKERVVEQLETELKKKHDYDEIKKELNIMKSIEFSSNSDDDYREGNGNGNGNGNSGVLITNEVGAPASGTSNPDSNEFQLQQEKQQQQKSLEVLFMEKNRALQNENTQLKSRNVELQFKYDETMREKLQLMNTNLEQKSLIVLLERDLLKLAKKNRMEVDDGSLSSSALSALSAAAVPENIINGDNDFDEETNGLVSHTSASATASASLFNIVSNQRERFRLRIQELEVESMGSKQQVLFLTNEIDRLRSDNVKLYEKIKFLQSSTSTTLNISGNGGGSGEEANTVLNKYTNEYEKRLDPFAKFNYKEKQKRYENLQLHDKFTLSFGKFVLSNKFARLIFCAYFFVIHLLIFMSLYHMAHHDAKTRDYSALCADAYKDHMAHAHGMSDFKVPHG